MRQNKWRMMDSCDMQIYMSLSWNVNTRANPRVDISASGHIYCSMSHLPSYVTWHVTEFGPIATHHFGQWCDNTICVAGSPLRLQSRPHKLVYAKLSGYSYWPAKVMQVKPDGCDVRFFGPGHYRYNNNSNDVDGSSDVIWDFGLMTTLISD